MILLDTHVWVWWITEDNRLSQKALSFLDRVPPQDVCVRVFSCWEVAMLHSRGRIAFPQSLDDWMALATERVGVGVLPLSISAVLDSCRLPGDFHGDPADRIIVATAREHRCPLVTADEKILRYTGVRAVHPGDVDSILGE
ncbi:MAG TPA: type II toxin-antitoxin system VapC family toxin [Candidatus Hydrogenedentes bacterium]|nr:type II toxin-antitoxin system VapC family toxin [Candidatus Hydrogenedentota bacterium]HOC73643.1 type II toxin-antitoxin system VapC family toxin [Candidatus Hydrogenedentota bacterium]HRZ84449.1 type II toxin-antitoxin system VapC family toxin [Candidatus Hydrogenedentota bacterium]